MNVKHYIITLTIAFLSMSTFCFGQNVNLAVDELLQEEEVDLNDLLAQVTDINEVYDNGTPYGTTLICSASCAGKLEIVGLLLEKGANVQVTNGFLHDALSEAVRCGQSNIVSWLLATPYYGNLSANAVKQLIYFTLPNNDLRSFQILSQKLPNQPNSQFYTDLMTATALNEKGELFKYFTKKGGNIYRKNELGETFLHTAANNTSILDFLTTNGLNVNEPSKLGQTPLHLSNNVEAVNLLLSLGADINVRDNFGWTPLHYAALDGDANLVKLFLEKGIDLTVVTGRAFKTSFGLTIEAESAALDITRVAAEYHQDNPILQQKYAEILDLLQR